jgi:hypothetical protein
MRVVGTRPERSPELRWPSSVEIARSVELAGTLPLAPKGVFRYRSHAEANADWERWTADAMARQAARLAVGAVRTR